MYTRNCEIRAGRSFPEGMHRIALKVEYVGTRFQGFQKQAATTNTVQGYLEQALSDIACEPITLVCAGRTDAGVHASAQIVHFDTVAVRPDKAWVRGVNTKLPDTIRVHWAGAVSPRFHARFSAKSRTYRYIFHCGDIRHAVLAKQVTHTRFTLDAKLMADAGQYLLGEHDFSAFRAAQCQAHSPVREVQKLRFFRAGELLVMEIQANAFLHHMVRNIAGSMIEVGRGAREPAWLGALLAAKNRNLAAATAHPWGLYFVDVDYDAGFAIPRWPLGPFFLTGVNA